MANKLVVRQTLGRNPNVRNCLTYVTDHHIAYVCGFQVVIINTETKEQNFISGTSTYQHQSLGITVIASNVSKRIIAVAEKVEPAAIVTFYDANTLRRKKMLTHADLGSSEIRAMAFSEDGRFLVTQSAGPEWNLVLWNVEKGAKFLCSAKIALSDETPVHRVSFCPWDPTVILVIGKSILRLFRYIEGQLRPMSITVRRDQANFISFAWLAEEQLVVGTEGGEIIIIESFEVRGAIMTSKEDADEFYPVLCLHSTARGFVMGSWHGELKVFEKHEDLKERYQLEDTFYIPGDCGHVMEIAMGTDETIICGMDRHHILMSTLSSLHHIKKGESVFEHIFTNFHHPNAKGEAEITGIDVAIWKPIVATCGKDNTVRIWNPIERKMEMIKEFEEEPMGLSLHPTGIYLAVMFQDKIRILSLLLEEMHQCREIPARQVSFIKFSRGGQYLASSNGTNLQVYATHTGQPVATLRGHNNRIKSVVWMNFDSRIVTMGAEGIVHVWDLFPVMKRMEHYPGNVPISTGTGPMDGSTLYIATHDKLVKELNFTGAGDGGGGAASSSAAAPTGTGAIAGASTGVVPVGANSSGAGAGSMLSSTIAHALEGVVKVHKLVELAAYVSIMLFDENRRFLLMGTANEHGPSSVVVAMTAPFLASNTMEINHLHAAPITAMCVSHDGSIIYSADAHGCVVISEYEGSQFTSAFVNQNNNSAVTAASASSANANTNGNTNNNNNNNNNKNAGGKQKEGTFLFEFQDEVVIHKTDLESRKSSIEQLHQQVEELNQNNEHQMRLKEMEFRDKLKEITDQATVQLKAEKIKYDELDLEKRALEKTFAEKVKILEEKHTDELSTIENKYKTKYNAEENRHKMLMEETKEAHDRWNEENKMLVHSHQKYMEELSRDYELKIVQEQTTQKEIQVYKEKISVKFDSLKGETEFDGDNEIAEIKIKYDALLRAEEDLKQQLAAQHAVLEKNLQTLVKEQENMELENKRMKDKQARVLESIHTQEKDIQSHKKEIREREETINDKDKRIYDLKKKNQELEKFRFVLDYKIKELKLQITPRETEIATMTKQIEEMNAELDQYNKSNLALNLMIDELKLKMEGIKAELRAQEDRCAISERFLEKFRRDVQELWTSRHDINAFKVGMIRLYRVYVQEDVSPATLGSSGGGKRDLDDPQQVYNRDREQMERSLDSLRRAMKTEAVAHRRDMGKMLRESVLLTKELNTMRKNFRSLYLQKKAIEQGGELGVQSNLADLIDILGLQQKKSHANGIAGGKRSKKGGEASQEELTDEQNPANSKIPKPPSSKFGSMGAPMVPVGRTTALRTTTAEGIVSRSSDIGGGGLAKGAVTRQDQWEAWREIQLQYDAMKELEDRVGEVCSSLGLDPIPLLVCMDTKLGE